MLRGQENGKGRFTNLARGVVEGDATPNMHDFALAPAFVLVLQHGLRHTWSDEEYAHAVQCNGSELHTPERPSSFTVPFAIIFS